MRTRKVVLVSPQVLLPMEYAMGRSEGLYTAITPSGYHAPLDEVDDLALLTLDPDCSTREPIGTLRARPSGLIGTTFPT